MSVSKEIFIREYVKSIRRGEAAIFAGAGLSRPSGYVDWKGLLKPLAEDIGLDVEKEHDLISIAQYCRNKSHSRYHINQRIMTELSKDAQPNENAEIIARLPISTYWTTNYDEVIENSIRKANRNPDVKSEWDQLTVIKPNRDAVVYKMHGDVNRPATAVLTKEDYDLYDSRRPMFRTILESDLISKRFLFFGFSFEDPNLNYILSQYHASLNDKVGGHYCFFKRVSKEEVMSDAEHEYELRKQEMKADALSYYGIQTVFVNKFEEMTEILREVEKTYNKNNVFISGSVAKYDDPWDQTKAEELAKKLAGALVKNDYRITSGYGFGIGASVIEGALNVIYDEKYRHVDEYLCLRPFPRNINDPAKKMEIYTEYRRNMIRDTGISIFMFGNKLDPANPKSGNIVESNGCRQEFEISKENGNIIIPIGSTGYTAKKILEEIKADIAKAKDSKAKASEAEGAKVYVSKYSGLEPYIEKLEKVSDIDKIVETVMEIIEKLTK